MARRNRNNETATTDTETVQVEGTTDEAALAPTATEVQEDTVSTTTEAPAAESTTAPAEAPEGTEAPAPAEAEAPVDLTAFQAAVDAAVAERDTSTGEVPEGLKTKVTAEYRALDGLKPKNAARKVVNDAMREAMNSMDIQLARSYMVLSDALTAGSGGGDKKEKAPADPTEAFVQRLGALYLAAELVSEAKPEGVGEVGERLDTLLEESREQAAQLVAWQASDAEDKGDEPEASAFVKAAVKLSQGKAARTGGGKSSGTTTPFTGERRDIGKHIAEAFAGEPVGKFLSIADIRKFESSEYPAGSNPASAGAISSRIFPTGGSGKPNLPEGIEPATSTEQDGVKAGNRGARKTA